MNRFHHIGSIQYGRKTPPSSIESTHLDIKVSFAPILLGHDRTEIILSQLRTNLADGLALRRCVGQLHKQTVGKLVAALVVVNVRRNHLDGPGLIKLLNKCSGQALALEPTKPAFGFVLRFQPGPDFIAIALRQKPGDVEQETL